MNLSSAPQESKLFGELTVKEQRESLQQTNPDALAGVFDYMHPLTENSLQLTCLENVLCCYPNQLQDGQIKLPADFGEGNIVIVSMGALRKGNIEIIAGNLDNLPKISTPVLLSPGVIEYYEKDGKKYTQTVLRDGGQSNTSSGVKGLADVNERTTTAGRNFSGKLWEDLEMENAEESPFLMKDAKGNYVLVSHKPEYKEALIASIQNYLQKKYLTSSNQNFEDVKKAFELKFKDVKYEELGDILRGIIQNDGFDFYTAENGKVDGLDSTHIKLGEQEGDFYVFIDSANNTIEYRAIRRITGFPEGLTPVGKIPLRLFLESQNQDPSFKRLENIGKYGAGEAKLVPTINEVAKLVQDALNTGINHTKIANSILEKLANFPNILERGYGNSKIELLGEYFSGREFGLENQVIHRMGVKYFPGDPYSGKYIIDTSELIDVESDSCVFDMGDFVVKVYFFLGKDDIETYRDTQNRIAQLTFEDIVHTGEHEGNQYSSIHINVLSLPHEIYGNDKHSVVFIPKETGTHFSYNKENQILEAITKEINRVGSLDISVLNIMNIKIKGVVDGVLQIVVTDIANSIQSDILGRIHPSYR